MSLLNTKEAAKYLGLSPRTLERWRTVGGGPAFVRLSRVKGVRYEVGAIERFVRERTRLHTSQEVADAR